MSLKVGVDIGGTFTDVALEDGPHRWSVKVPTTPAAPELAVLDGVEKGLAAAGRCFADMTLLVHGTTLATNALIERKGARTALLTTAGFRDVLEMGNEGRFDQYDTRALKPLPLVPRHLRFTVRERLRHDGSVIEPLDEAGVAEAGLRMRDAGVEAVAIAFLHAYANGDHEARARDILLRAFDFSALSTSHEVSPQMREYERISTTCANAYLQPVVSGYLLRLEASLKAKGLAGPMLLMLSSGGLTTVETASRFPIRLLESGPAGGAIFACDIAKRLDLDRVLSFDVGGTTAKFCMVDEGQVRHSLAFEVARTYRFKKGSGLPVRVPVVDLVEIGAGGGSIARVDAVGRITVGPDSAGSEPGPACYRRGGLDATVTDCDLVLGKLDAETFAGGSMRLDADLARGALDAAVARTVEMSAENAAFAVTETVTEAMASAARVHAAEVGTEIEARTLIAFGGAAPLHAARFAEKLAIHRVVIPSGAGVGSAIGFLRAPIAYEVVRSLPAVIGDALAPAVREALRDMQDRAEAIVRPAGSSSGAPLVVQRSVYMRYVGQGHEIEVSIDADPDGPDLETVLRHGFERTYMQTYGQLIEGNPIEATIWTVKVSWPHETAVAIPSAPTAHPALADATRRVFDGETGVWQEWPQYDRVALQPGAQAPGPAIITESETTTVVPASFGFRIGPEGFIWLDRTENPL